MNIITDTIDEIRKMRVRKVWWSTLVTIDCDIVLATRLEFWYDYMLCTNDMENTNDCNKHWESCCGRTQVSAIHISLWTLIDYF